jgi:hypothetical protein
VAGGKPKGEGAINLETVNRDVHSILNNPMLWYWEKETGLPLRIVLVSLVNADLYGHGLASIDLRDFQRDYARCLDFYELDKATKFLHKIGWITREDVYIHSFTSIRWQLHREKWEASTDGPPTHVRGAWQISPTLRLDIGRRDEFRCAYCHDELASDKLALDHVIPRPRGGSDTQENLVTCCPSCNSKKGSRTPHEAGMPWPHGIGAYAMQDGSVYLHDGIDAVAWEWR